MVITSQAQLRRLLRGQAVPKKRSLAELDDVIDEIVARNPELGEALDKIIMASMKTGGSLK